MRERRVRPVDIAVSQLLQQTDQRTVRKAINFVKQQHERLVEFPAYRAQGFPHDERVLRRVKRLFKRVSAYGVMLPQRIEQFV